MQAITTKYAGPTNSRGGRIIASAAAGRMTISWDHALGVYENHRAAAHAFAKKKDWKGKLVGGQLKSGAYAWVFAKR